MFCTLHCSPKTWAVLSFPPCQSPSQLPKANVLFLWLAYSLKFYPIDMSSISSCLIFLYSLSALWALRQDLRTICGISQRPHCHLTNWFWTYTKTMNATQLLRTWGAHWKPSKNRMLPFPGNWNHVKGNFTKASGDVNEDAVRRQLKPISPALSKCLLGAAFPFSRHSFKDPQAPSAQ
jgi:hypothetical protein